MTCEEPGCRNQAEYRVPFRRNGFLLKCADHANGQGERLDGQFIFYGGRIRQAREARGMSRQECADHLGITEGEYPV